MLVIIAFTVEVISSTVTDLATSPSMATSQFNDVIAPTVSDLTSSSFALSDLQLPPLLMTVIALALAVPILSAVLKKSEENGESISESKTSANASSTPIQASSDENTPLVVDPQAEVEAAAAKALAMKLAKEEADRKYAENQAKSAQLAAERRRKEEEERARAEAERLAKLKAEEEAKAAARAAREIAIKRAQEEADRKYAANYLISVEISKARKAAEEAAAKKAAEEAAAKKAAEEAAAKKAVVLDDKELEAEEAEAIRASEMISAGKKGMRQTRKQAVPMSPEDEATSNVAKLAELIADSQKDNKGGSKDQFEDTILAIERAAQLTYPDKTEEEVFALLDEPITLLAKLPIIK